MLKNFCFAAAATLILTGAVVTAAPAPADARSNCDRRAEVAYPHNKEARKEFKKRCKADYRMWKKRNDKGIWIIL